MQNICRVNAYKVRAKSANLARWNRTNNKHKKADVEENQSVTTENDDPTRIQQGILQASINVARKDSQQNTEYKKQNTKNKIQNYINTSTPPLRSGGESIDSAHEVITPQVKEKILAPWDDGYVEPVDEVSNTTLISSSNSLVQIDDQGVSGTLTLKRGRSASKPKSAKTEGANLVIATYVELYREKFGGATPAIRPRDARAAKAVVEQFGLEKTKHLLKAYLRMGNKWFATRHYDLVTFEGNLNAVSMFYDKGVSISDSMAKSLETHANNEAVCARVLERYSSRSEP